MKHNSRRLLVDNCYRLSTVEHILKVIIVILVYVVIKRLVLLSKKTKKQTCLYKVLIVS